MSDEVFLGGKNYVSSKRAADTSGYARDYIGQLARAGLIDAQRVGGLWYVAMESLEAYKRNADALTPIIPQQKATLELDTVVNFDGKEYISASRAAKITSYNQDYIGQLARGGKINSRQIGNRWYVEREGLLKHKAEKDRLLASVQAESLGLRISKPAIPQQLASDADRAPMLTYIREENPLMPALNKHDRDEISPIQPHRSDVTTPIERSIPIRVSRPMPNTPLAPRATQRRQVKKAARGVAARLTEAGVALTFVILLSYGFVSLKNNSLYAFRTESGASAISAHAFTASAADAFGRIASRIEQWVVPELTYIRKN
ncbi:MAG: hypothetical protein WC050_02290 [Candidatus Paceibacterota bacterium]